jgi:hypothetical protein
VTWHDEPVPITVEQALLPNSSIPKEQEQAFVGRECDQWLRKMLTTGPVLHARLMSVGGEAEFTVDGLKRAKSRIGVIAFRDGFGPRSRFYWQMKDAFIRASWAALFGPYCAHTVHSVHAFAGAEYAQYVHRMCGVCGSITINAPIDRPEDRSKR